METKTNETPSTINAITRAADEICDLLFDCIAGRGTRGIPSGEIYAHVMQYMDLATYQTLIDALVASGRVTSRRFLLTAR